MRTTSFLSPMGGVMLVLLLCAISSVNSYSKYGRGCGDIGCLPNEVCVLSHDSCGFGQRDGKECGNYPTCKKSGAASSNSGGVKPSENDDKFNGLVLSQVDDDYDGLLLRVARSVQMTSGSEGHGGKNNVADAPRKKRRKTKSRKAYENYENSGSGLSKPKKRKGNLGAHRIANELLNKYKRQRINDRDSTNSNQKSQQIGAEGSSEKLHRVERSVSMKDQEEAMPMSEDANVHLQVQGYGPGNGQRYGPPVGNGQGPNRQGTGQRQNGMQWQQQRGPGMQNGPYGRGGQGQRPGQGQGRRRRGYSQGPNGRPNQYELGGRNQNGRGGNGPNGRMGGGGRGQGPWQVQGRGGVRQGPGGLCQGGNGQDNNQGTSTTTSEPSDTQYPDQEQYQDYAAYDQVTDAGDVQSLRRFARVIDEHITNDNLEELQMTDGLLHLPSRSLFGKLKGKGNQEKISTAAPLARNVRNNTSPLAKQSNLQLTGGNANGGYLHRVARGLLDKFNHNDKKNGAVPSQPNADSATRPQQTGERQGSVQKTGVNSKPKSLHRVARGLFDKFNRKDKKTDAEVSPATTQQANTVPVSKPQQTGARQGSAQKTGVKSKPKSLHRVARGLFDKFNRKDKKTDAEASPAVTPTAVGQQANTVSVSKPQPTGDRQGSAQKTGVNSKPKSLHRVARGLFDKFNRKDKKTDAEVSPATTQQANTVPVSKPQQTGARQGSAQKTGVNSKPKSLHRVTRGLFDKFSRKDKKTEAEATPATVGPQANTVPVAKPQQTGARQSSAQKTGVNSKPKSLHRVTRGLFDKFNRKDKKNDAEATPATVGQQANTVPVSKPQQTGARQGSAQKAGVNSKPKSLHRVTRGLFDKFNRKDKKSDAEATPATLGQKANTVPVAKSQQTGARQGSAQKAGVNSKPNSLHRVARGLFDKFNRKDKKTEAEATPATVGQQANSVPVAKPQQTGARQGSAQKTGVNSKPTSLHRVARGLFDKFNRKDKKSDAEDTPATTPTAVGQQANTVPVSKPQQTGARQGSAQKTGFNSKPTSLHRVARGLFDKFNRKDKKTDAEASPAVTPTAVGQKVNTVPVAKSQQTGARQGSAKKAGVNSKPNSLHRVARGLFDKFNRKDKKTDAEATPATVGQQANTAPAARPQKTGTKRDSVQSRVVRAIASQNDRAGFRPKANSEQVNQQRVNGNGQRGQGQNRQAQGQSRQALAQNRQSQRRNSQPSTNFRGDQRQRQNSRQVPSANGRIGYSQRSSDGRTGVFGSSRVGYQSRSGSQFSGPPEFRPEEWSQESRYRDNDRGYDRYSGYDSNGYDQRRGPPRDDGYRTYNQYPPLWSGGPPPSSSNTYQSSYPGGQPIYQPQRAGTVPSQQGGYQSDYQTSSYVYYPNRGSNQNGYSTQVGTGGQAYTQGGPAYGQPTVSSSGYTFVQFPNGTSVHYGVAMEPVATETTTTADNTTAAPAPFALSASINTKK